MTSLPNAAASASGGLLTYGTSTGQLNPSGGKVTAATVDDKTNYALSSGGLDTIVIETGVNCRQAIQAVAAVLAGESTDVDTGSPVFKGIDSATTRVSGTSSGGNRSSITLNLS
jgi:hypothetical protein